MDLTIGIETRDEYHSLEVAKGAMTMDSRCPSGETRRNSTYHRRYFFWQTCYRCICTGCVCYWCYSHCDQLCHSSMCSYGSAGTGSSSGRESRCMDWGFFILYHAYQGISECHGSRYSLYLPYRYGCGDAVKTVTRVNYDLMIELGEHFKKILGEADKGSGKEQKRYRSHCISSWKKDPPFWSACHTEGISDHAGGTDQLVSYRRNN